MIVNEENVVECWKEYEKYYDNFYKEYYKNVTCEDFIKWCNENLTICPNCEKIKNKIKIINSDSNVDEVCIDCIGDGYYE